MPTPQFTPGQPKHKDRKRRKHTSGNTLEKPRRRAKPKPKPKKKRLRLTRAVGRGGLKLIKSKVGILGAVGGGAYLAGKERGKQSYAEWPQERPYNNLPDTVSIKVSQERHADGVIWWAEFLDNDQLGDMVGIDGPFPNAVALVKQVETWAIAAGYGIDVNSMGKMNSRGESIITASKKIVPEEVRGEMATMGHGHWSLNSEFADGASNYVVEVQNQSNRDRAAWWARFHEGDSLGPIDFSLGPFEDSIELIKAVESWSIGGGYSVSTKNRQGTGSTIPSDNQIIFLSRNISPKTVWAFEPGGSSLNKEQSESSDFRGPVDDIISAVDRGLMPEDEAARRIRIFLARQGATEHVQQQAEVATKSRSWRTLGVILAGVGIVGGFALGSYGPTRALKRAVGSARTSRGMAIRRGQHRVLGRTAEERRVGGTGGILGRLLRRIPRRGQDIERQARDAENLARREARKAKDSRVFDPLPWRKGPGSHATSINRTTGAPGTGDRPSYRPDPPRGFTLGSRGSVPVSMGGFGSAGTPSKTIQNDVLGKAALSIQARLEPVSKKRTSAMLSKIRNSMKSFDEMLDELMIANHYTPGAENRAANDIAREQFAGALRAGGMFTGKWSNLRDYQFSEGSDFEEEYFIRSSRGPHDITVDKDPRDNKWDWKLNGKLMGSGFRTRQEAQANALGWVQSMTKGAISPITNFIGPDHIKVMLPMTDPPLDFDSDEEIQGFAEGDTLYIDIVNIDSSNDLPPGHLLVGDHMGGSPQRTFGVKIGGDLLAWGWDTVEEVREWVKESILVGELVPGWMLTHDAFDQRNRIKLMEIQSYTSLNTESDAEDSQFGWIDDWLNRDKNPVYTVETDDNYMTFSYRVTDGPSRGEEGFIDVVAPLIDDNEDYNRRYGHLPWNRPGLGFEGSAEVRLFSRGRDVTRYGFKRGDVVKLIEMTTFGMGPKITTHEDDWKVLGRHVRIHRSPKEGEDDITALMSLNKEQGDEFAEGKRLFHLTLTKNVPSIMREGLDPQMSESMDNEGVWLTSRPSWAWEEIGPQVVAFQTRGDTASVTLLEVELLPYDQTIADPEGEDLTGRKGTPGYDPSRARFTPNKIHPQQIRIIETRNIHIPEDYNPYPGETNHGRPHLDVNLGDEFAEVTADFTGMSGIIHAQIDDTGAWWDWTYQLTKNGSPVDLQIGSSLSFDNVAKDIKLQFIHGWGDIILISSSPTEATFRVVFNNSRRIIASFDEGDEEKSEFASFSTAIIRRVADGVYSLIKTNSEGVARKAPINFLSPEDAVKYLGKQEIATSEKIVNHHFDPVEGVTRVLLRGPDMPDIFQEHSDFRLLRRAGSFGKSAGEHLYETKSARRTRRRWRRRIKRKLHI